MGLRWELASGWGTKKLGTIAPENASQVRPSDNPTIRYNYWGLDAIESNQFTEPPVNWITGSDVASTCVSFDPSHVLYAKLRPYLNKVIVPTVEGIGSTEWVALKPVPEMVNRYYLAYVLRTRNFVHYANANSTGARLPRVRKEALWDADIPIPYPDDPPRSLDVQRRIVARIEALFTEVREMRELQADIYANTNRLMDTVLAEIFAPSEVARWPNVEPLGNLTEITASMVDPTLPEYSVLPHIYGASIEEGTGRLLAYNSAGEDGMTSSKYHFQPGAVLYSKIRPYLRKVTIVDFEGVCSADMYPLQLKNGALTSEFLMWSLLSPRFTDYANNLSGRARMPKLNRSQLFDYEIPYPSHEAQKRITARLSAVRDEIAEMRKSNQDDFERIDQLEQAILAQAFRGEL